MTIIRVTASVGFDYDTADGIVTSVAEAIEDTLDVIDSGDIPAQDYTVEAVEGPVPPSWVVVRGNPVDGFSFIGPYPSHEDAVLSHDSVDTEWWVDQLVTPDSGA